MFYGNGDSNYGEGAVKKRSAALKIIKWMIYLLCILILAVLIYRFVSTGLPKELKNYIIKNPEIEETYNKLKDKFKIYKMDIRNPFGWGDALFIENVYYLENAENLQFTMRCKTNRFEYFSDSINSASSIRAFGAYLKVSEITGVDETSDAAQNYIVIEHNHSQQFGEFTDRYIYFVFNFDGVKIDFENSRVELYIFTNSFSDVAPFDEDKALARFTIFDVTMSMTKMQAKKFNLD